VVTRLWWVRHAPTHVRAFAGWRDIPADLSDTSALRRLHLHLPASAMLASSDLVRAVATADALAEGRHRLPPDPGLREFHFGDWDGLDWAEVSTRWPDLSRAYWETPGDVAAPGGESWNTAAARVSAAADALAAIGGDVVVVAHFGAILSQYARAAGLVPDQALAQRIDNLSVTCLAHDRGRWSVLSVNHCP
jgi:broad specificity phosphatase PhoE